MRLSSAGIWPPMAAWHKQRCLTTGLTYGVMQAGGTMADGTIFGEVFEDEPSQVAFLICHTRLPVFSQDTHCPCRHAVPMQL